MTKFQKRNTRSAKLDQEQVRMIRRRYGQGESQGSLARELGLSIGQIGRIVRGEAWQSVKPEPTDKEIAESAQRLLAQLRADGIVPLPDDSTGHGEELLSKMMQEAAEKKRPERELNKFTEKKEEKPE